MVGGDRREAGSLAALSYLRWALGVKALGVKAPALHACDRS